MGHRVRTLANVSTALSVVLTLTVLVAWTLSYTSPWTHSILRDRGDFHLRMSSAAGAFVIGETHHFEEWRADYWKLLLIFGSPWSMRLRRHAARRRRHAGLCPACGYDLRATPDRCPECGAVPASST